MFADLFSEAKQLCRKYDDIFTMGTISLASSSSGSHNASLCYTGPRPPMNQIDQFAFMLIDLINRGSGAAAVFGPGLVR